MKRTGLKKLELKRLTVKQLADVSGAGMVRRTTVGSACSDSCTCASAPCIYDYVPGAGCEDPNCAGCDIHVPPPACGGGCGCGY